jgi:hypothetical protein
MIATLSGFLYFISFLIFHFDEVSSPIIIGAFFGGIIIRLVFYRQLSLAIVSGNCPSKAYFLEIDHYFEFGAQLFGQGFQFR